jgi:hypothetical protein
MVAPMRWSPQYVLVLHAVIVLCPSPIAYGRLASAAGLSPVDRAVCGPYSSA